MNYYLKKLSFEEVKENINYFLENEITLKNILDQHTFGVGYLFKYLINSIEYAIEHPDAPQNLETYDDEINDNIILLNYYLLSYYLQDKYDYLEILIVSHMNLLNNFCKIYEDKISEDFNDSTLAINNLIKTASNFSRLIALSDVLITKYEKGRAMREEPFSITKTYLQEIFDEIDNLKEAE